MADDFFASLQLTACEKDVVDTIDHFPFDGYCWEIPVVEAEVT
jgi:hypothetical protein